MQMTLAKVGHTGEMALPRWQRKIGPYWEGDTLQMAKENWAILALAIMNR